MHTIYSYGGGEYLYYIFNFIALLVSGNGISTNVIRMVSLLGVSWSVLLMYIRNSLIPGLIWFLWFAVASFLVIGPKGTINILDPIAYGAVSKSVDNVPLILAIGASSFIAIGHNITEKMESVFMVPGSSSYLKYIETGALFGSKVIKKLQEVRIEDPAFNANLTRFVQQCVIYDAMIGKKYTLKDLRVTKNIWELVSSKASNILGFLYKDDNRNEILTCKEGANLLNDKWQEVINQTASKEGRRLFAAKRMGEPHDLEQAAKNAFLTKLPQSYKMFTGVATDAVELLKQQLMINVLRDAPAKKASQLGDSYAVAKATLQQRNSYQIAGIMAEESLVVMRAVFEALIYGSFVFVYILLFLPQGYKILGYYFQAICWIQLWAPLYAILNFIMTLYGHYQSRAILGGGLNRANSAALIDLHTDITALAGCLALSVPYISFILINKGGVAALVNIASRLGSELGGTISSAAQEQISGNIALGNFSQGNTSLQTMNAYKHNMNVDYQSGQFSRNLDSGAIKITNAAGNIYLAGPGKTGSTFNTDLTDSNNLSMQLNKQAQQEKSLIDGKAIDYAKQVTNTQRDVADLLSKVANSNTNMLTQAHDSSFSSNQTLQNAIDFSAKLQKKFGIAGSAALELSIGMPRIMKLLKLGGIKATFKGSGGINYTADDISDFAESEGYKENFDTIARAVRGSSFNETQVTEKSLQQQISSSYEQADLLRENISAQLQKSTRLSNAASLLAGSNYDTRVIRTQDFLDYIANSPATNGHGRIGYDTAASIIDATYGSLAERKQEFLESFQEMRTQKAVDYFATHEIKNQVDLDNAFNDLNNKIGKQAPQLDHSAVINRADDIVFNDSNKEQMVADFYNKENIFDQKKAEFAEEVAKRKPKQHGSEDEEYEQLKMIQQEQMWIQ